MPNDQHITLRVDKHSLLITSVTAVSEDQGAAILKIRLRDSCGIFSIPPGALFYITLKAPSGYIFEGGYCAVSDFGNAELRYPLPLASLTAPGRYKATITMRAEDKKLTLQPFSFRVNAKDTPSGQLPPAHEALLDAIVQSLAKILERVEILESSGTQGEQGEPGMAATIEIGTVTTSADGAPRVINSGSNNAAVLDFQLPGGTEQRAKRYIHLSVDDVSICLADLKQHAYTSVFQQNFFASLKSLHDNYGASFSLYAYADSTINLPLDFTAELSQSAGWLKFGIHSKNAAHTFETETAANAAVIYNAFVANILAFIPDARAIDRMPRLHEFKGNLAVMQALRDCPCGILGALTPEPQNPDAGMNDRAAYYLTADHRFLARQGAKLLDIQNALTFAPTSIRTDWFNDPALWGAVYPESGGSISALLSAWAKDAQKAGAMNSLKIFGHEWSPNLLTHFQQSCVWAASAGYRFSFDQDEMPAARLLLPA
jgi:hypothetical protein